MTGVGRPGHWLGTVVAKFLGFLVVKADNAEDIEYIELKHYDFDVTPTGIDSAGQEG